MGKANARNGSGWPTRVVIERLSPEIDCGRFAIKRVAGETVTVEADVFADGHDRVGCQILYCEDAAEPQSSPMWPLGNDRWRVEFTVAQTGRYQYTVEAPSVLKAAFVVDGSYGRGAMTCRSGDNFRGPWARRR